MSGLYDDLKLFTDREQLYSKVSQARMLEIIKDKRVTVTRSDRSHNSYGEFRFITVTMRRKYPGQPAFREAITFYGNGYHEYRECSPDGWSFYVGNSWSERDKPALNKRAVIADLVHERAGMTFDGPKSNAFTFLADMGDEDSAYSELCM